MLLWPRSEKADHSSWAVIVFVPSPLLATGVLEADTPYQGPLVKGTWQRWEHKGECGSWDSGSREDVCAGGFEKSLEGLQENETLFSNWTRKAEEACEQPSSAVIWPHLPGATNDLVKLDQGGSCWKWSKESQQGSHHGGDPKEFCFISCVSVYSKANGPWIMLAALYYWLLLPSRGLVTTFTLKMLTLSSLLLFA